MGIISDYFSKKASANYMNSLTGDKGENFADNKFLQDYQKELEKNTKKLNSNKQFDLKNLYSERYILDKDIGQPTDTRPEGWTGLYTRSQMGKAGMSPKEMNVSSADIHSTAIARMRYNPKSENLYITFTSGDKEYLYPRVDKETVLKMSKAPSKGEYFQENITPYAVSKEEAVQIKKQFRNK